MQILIYPDSGLRQICRSSFTIGDKQIAEMFQLLKENNGLGLSANQVGINARLFITYWGEIFINPIITYQSKIIQLSESCLSLPEAIVKKNRFDTIVMSNEQRYVGHQARIIQHELDHLNGILIID